MSRASPRTQNFLHESYPLCWPTEMCLNGACSIRSIMKLVRFAVSVAMACAAVSSQEHSPGPPPSSELLRNANSANDAFAAVGRFQGAMTCTGAVIDPSRSGASIARAWLLTAGHCISLEPYGVIRNQPSTAAVQLKFFIDTTPESRVTVRARSVGCATMKGLDLALVELDTTLGDLSARGIRPLRLSTRSRPSSLLDGHIRRADSDGIAVRAAR